MRHPFDPRHDPRVHALRAARLGPGFPGFPGGPDFPGGFGGVPPFDFPGGFERGRGRRGERGPWGRHGHGRGRARRGNVRAAVLALLAERSMHGYEIIQEITRRSGGIWRPSPGSVYPTLQLLADEGLVTVAEGSSGKRLYALTEAGRAEAERQDGTPPWEQIAGDVDPADMDLRSVLGQLNVAARQVAQAAAPNQKARAAKVLTEARQKLYLILAEAGAEESDDVPDAFDDDEADTD